MTQTATAATTAATGIPVRRPCPEIPTIDTAIRALVRQEVALVRAMPDDIAHMAPLALVRAETAPALIPLAHVVRVSTHEDPERVTVRLQGDAAATVYHESWTAFVVRVARHHRALHPDVPLQYAWMLVSDRRSCYTMHHVIRMSAVHFAVANPLGEGTDLEVRYVLPGPPEIVEDEQIQACQSPAQLQRQQDIGWPNVIGEV